MGHVITLANSIIGVGILAMPYCFQKCGIVLSICLLVFSNLMTRKSCHYLIRASIFTRRKNVEFLAFHIFGPSGKFLVELCVIGFMAGTCITYYVVVGDLGPQIISKLFDIQNTDTLRTIIMVVVTVVCVIPLGLLRNIDSLSIVCAASIGFYLCLVLKVMSESAYQLTTGEWSKYVVYWRPAGILQCLPIFSMALSCQLQLFEVYQTVNNVSLEKMDSIVAKAANICTSVYIFVGTFGYIAFSTQPFSGNILMNFSPSATSDVIKLGFIFSVAFSFPLVIFPCRASLCSLLFRRNHSDASHYIPEHRFRFVTLSIIAATLLIGIFIPSIELIIGLVGSTIGIAICIMFPASCYIALHNKESIEKHIARMILSFAFVLMILGTYANLSAIDERSSGSHLNNNPVADTLPVINLKDIQEPVVTEKVVDIKLENNVKLKDEPELIEANNVLKPPDLNVPPLGKETLDHIKKIVSDGKAVDTKNDEEKILKNSDINKEAIKKEDLEISLDVKNKVVEGINDIKEELKKIHLNDENKDELIEIKKKIEEIKQIELHNIEELEKKEDKEHRVEENSKEEKIDEEKIEENVKEPAVVEWKPLKAHNDAIELNNLNEEKNKIENNISNPIVQLILNQENQVDEVKIDSVSVVPQRNDEKSHVLEEQKSIGGRDEPIPIAMSRLDQKHNQKIIENEPIKSKLPVPSDDIKKEAPVEQIKLEETVNKRDILNVKSENVSDGKFPAPSQDLMKEIPVEQIKLEATVNKRDILNVKSENGSDGKLSLQSEDLMKQTPVEQIKLEPTGNKPDSLNTKSENGFDGHINLKNGAPIVYELNNKSHGE